MDQADAVADVGNDMPASRTRPAVSRFAPLVNTLLIRCTKDEDMMVNAPTEVLDGFLFLGDAENSDNLQQLQHFGITHIINATTFPEFGTHVDLKHCFLRLRDQEDENISETFDEACDFLSAARATGGRVLVHCMAGKSRSATLVLVYLMRSERMPLADAFLFVKKKRKFIQPNIGFWKQLAVEELKVLGIASGTPAIYREQLELQKQGGQAPSPVMLFKRYMYLDSVASAAGMHDDAERENRECVLAEWPVGLPSAAAVQDIFLSSMDGSDGARFAAVSFVAELLSRGRFARGEIAEGFQLFSQADFQDLRLDCPRLDEYVAEIATAAEQMGLLLPEAARCFHAQILQPRL